MGEYFAWDYELPGFYHVYDLDNEPEWVDLPNDCMLQIWAPDSPEMAEKIQAVVDALDAAVTAAVAMRGQEP
jgi:hypothetical protein